MFLSVHDFPLWDVGHDRSGLGLVLWIGFKRLSGSWEREPDRYDEGLFSRESVGDRRAGSRCVPDWVRR